ncbi:MAG: hypothetical protein CO117_07805 [Flavobacteriaceae bacterium CG_4_9_14_3_um_filter_33_16]|nr:MAG: hypothetical protein CO117_07805 [Flavobacteriaceae bacterium CG_4_9_14_3_um_filter_33_16]
MRYIEIFEDSNNIDMEYYLTEGCGIFAYVLSKILNDGDIAVFSDPDGEEWSDEIPYEVTHVALRINDSLYDVRGKRTIGNMIDIDFPQGMREVDLVNPEGFKKEYMDGTDTTPLYAPQSDDIQNITAYVKSNPELFDLSINETSTAGGTSAGGIATAVGGLGAGFDPSQEWRSIYPKKKKTKTLIIKR